MKPIRRFLARLKSLTRIQQDEERLRAEIEEYLALETDANLRAGLSPREARRQAVLKFGGVEDIKERTANREGCLSCKCYRVGKEARCCNSTTWSQKDEWWLVSYDLYTHLRDHTKGFAELAAFSAGEDLFAVRRGGSLEPAGSYPGEFVSGNYFLMFGVQPFAGRTLAPGDDQKGATPVAMMSYRLWQERYARDPSVVGNSFNLNNKPYTIVGITPPAFYGDQLRNPPPDFFVPLHADEANLVTPNQYWLDLIGRAHPGVGEAALQAEMRAGLKQWLGAHWDRMNPNERSLFPQQTLYIRPGGVGITGMRDQYEHWLRILLMASGFVLLIVCASVANLMLVRGMEQRRQTCVCMALGAQAARLVRQALTESILLAFVGGAAGLALAFAGTRVILEAAFPTRAGLGAVPITASPSLPMLLFVCAVSLLTGIAFGFGPAWMATRADPAEALRGSGRATVRTGSLSRRALVVVQTALSLALLSAAGLLTMTLYRLENRNFGFTQDRRLVVNIAPKQAGYALERLSPLYRRTHDLLMARSWRFRGCSQHLLANGQQFLGRSDPRAGTRPGRTRR